MNYRADIDGLRALAVSAVIFFHAGFSGFSGGYLGVDVFFVISGYLIAHVVVASYGRPGALVNFYSRRIARLLPALYLVLFSTLLALYFFALPDFLVSYAKSMMSVIFFYSNFFFYSEAGYFSEAAERLPLLHTWSLSVEEQFYLFFPFLIFFLLKYFSNFTLRVVGGLAVASFAGYIWAVFFWPNGAFFFTPIRGWELLWGAFLALCSRQVVLNMGTRLADALCCLSLFLIGSSFYLVNSSINPLWGAGVVFFSGVLLCFTPYSSFIKRLLSLRALISLGVLSYSLYLWHQPVFAGYRVIVEPHISTSMAWVLISISLLLSVATYRMVENPFRKKYLAGRQPAFAFFFLCGGGLYFVCWLIVRMDGVEARFDESVSRYFKSNTESGFRYVLDCHANLERQFSTRGCGVGDFSDDASTLLYGDSHAGAIAYSLGNYLKAEGGVRMFTNNGCRPLLERYLGVSGQEDIACRQFNEHFLSYLEGHAPVDRLIVSFRWPADYPEGNRRGTGLLGGFSRVPLEVVNPDNAREMLADDMRRTLSRISQMTRRMVLIYPIPRAGVDVPEMLSHTALRGAELATIDYKSFEQEAEYVTKMLDSIQGDNILRLRPADVLCSSLIGVCRVADEYGSYYIDDNHLSVRGGDALLNNSGFRELLK